ncbi:hypothetical protein [Arthrobacter sp. Soil736]|uniref:hypothetical protein n=1 Tax=Arthrobacter sp. Soil736 TaxID=1736395 RepID=UPI0012F7FD6E|nr:hypothetical protein [Arthrobacter sp. Soil736]
MLTEPHFLEFCTPSGAVRHELLERHHAVEDEEGINAEDDEDTTDRFQQDDMTSPRPKGCIISMTIIPRQTIIADQTASASKLLAEPRAIARTADSSPTTITTTSATQNPRKNGLVRLLAFSMSFAKASACFKPTTMAINSVGMAAAAI